MSKCLLKFSKLFVFTISAMQHLHYTQSYGLHCSLTSNTAFIMDTKEGEWNTFICNINIPFQPVGINNLLSFSVIIVRVSAMLLSTVIPECKDVKNTGC